MLLKKDWKNIMTEKKDRLDYLDYLRVIACFSVIIVHVSAIGIVSSESGSLYNKGIILFNRFFKYTTPVFLFLSGITSFYGYRNREYKYIDFLNRRLKTVVFPFLIWSSIYYLILVYTGTYEFDFIFYIKNLILGNMSYHLYFIPILLQMYFLSGIINYFLKKMDAKKVVLISVIINILFMKLYFPYSDRFFGKYILFYILGVYLTKEYDTFVIFIKNIKIPVTIIFFTSTFFYAVFYYIKRYDLMDYAWLFFSVSGIFFLFNISRYLEKKDKFKNKQIRKLSKSTYYIYLIHPLVLSFISRVLSVYEYNLTTILLIYFSFTFFVSILISTIYTELKSKHLIFNKK
jgi:surface polysaccharide O-acyltransferase-like enzyme